jgi:hypothetical protein
MVLYHETSRMPIRTMILFGLVPFYFGIAGAPSKLRLGGVFLWYGETSMFPYL